MLHRPAGHRSSPIPRLTLALGLSAAVASVPWAAEASAVAAPADPGCAGSYEYVVVGVPTYRSGEGAVDVRRTGLDGAGTSAQLLTRAGLGLGSPTTADRFGSAVEQLDVNDDGCTDLLIGAPGAGTTGQAYLVLNSPEGFGRGAVSLALTTRTARAPGDGFGTAIGVTHDAETGLESGVDEQLTLWVGAPGRDVAGEADAGALWEFDLDVRYAPAVGTPAFTLAERRVVVQGERSIPGLSEAGDRFGEVISDSYPHTSGEPRADLLTVGVPGEDVGNEADAGSVIIIPGDPGRRRESHSVHQDRPGVPGEAEAGDRFGAAVSGDDEGYAVGVPGEDIRGVVDTGMVQLFDADGTPGPAIDQDVSGVPGVNEAGDRFGASVAGTWMDTFIGVPGEDIGSVRDAGSIVVRTRSGTQVSYAARSQGSGVSGASEAGDRLGAVMMTGDLNEDSRRVFIGVPGEDIGSVRDAGRVLVYRDFWTRVSELRFSLGDRADIRYGEVFGQNLSR